MGLQETDFQQNFHLGAVGHTQTVQSELRIIDDATTATLVSSKIPGISDKDFDSIWKFALHPVYRIETEKMAHAGVPLPFLQGFQFLFDRATVRLQPGYADVLANMRYVGSQKHLDALMEDPGSVDLASFVTLNGASGQHGDNGHADVLAARSPEPVTMGAANRPPTLSRTRTAASQTRLVQRDDPREPALGWPILPSHP